MKWKERIVYILIILLLISISVIEGIIASHQTIKIKDLNKKIYQITSERDASHQYIFDIQKINGGINEVETVSDLFDFFNSNGLPNNTNKKNQSSAHSSKTKD